MNERDIPGVPMGMRIKRVDLEKPNSFEKGWNTASIEMEPDNVYGVPLESVKIPEGWELVSTDWFREPLYTSEDVWLTKGGLVVAECGRFRPHCDGPDRRRIIVKRIDLDKTPKKPVIVRTLIMGTDIVPDDDPRAGHQGTVSYSMAVKLMQKAPGIYLRIEEKVG